MKVVEILFSPTGGTKKVADIISKALGERVKEIDLSNPKTDFSTESINPDDLAVIAMPSFGGRAPAVALERLGKINGAGAKCVLICVYGNRDYEDTLVEMEDTAKKCGFKVIAAVAAVAQHSIMPQYASGRPDTKDETELTEFAQRILEEAGENPEIPGNRPYKKGGGAAMVPKPKKNCNACGLCVTVCPVEAIDPKTFKAVSDKCISCMRCIAVCPVDARQLNKMMVSAAALALKKACSGRKDNELFV